MRYLSLVFAASLLCLSIPCTGHAQSAVVTGSVTDSTSGASIPRATIRVADSFEGTAADTSGRYRLALEAGSHVLVVQAVGYTTVRRAIRVRRADTTRVDVRLAPETLQLGTVTVEAAGTGNAPSVHRLSAASLKNAPALGEPDVIRTVGMLPSVTQTNDLKSSLNVRGGASDQNQYLIDGIEVYNPNHLAGLLGPFNVQALEDVTVHAAQFPARYGGRLSSVIDLQTRRPPDTTFVRGNVSLVSASGVASRQLGDGGVTLAARRTYADPVLAAVGSGFWYNFHDINLRAFYELGSGVTLETLGFLSRDAVSPRTTASADSGSTGPEITWGGRMGALRLRHQAGSYRHRLTGSYVRSYLSGSVRGEPDAYFDNGIRSLTAAYRGQWTNRQTQVSVGAELDRQSTEYGWQEAGDVQIEELIYEEAPPAFQQTQERPLYVGYASVERHLGLAWSVQAGLRYSFAGPDGVSSGQWAPRFRLSYDASDQVTLTATTGRYLQYVAEGAEGKEFRIDEPTFLLSSPQTAWTTTLGATWQARRGVEVGAEAYYRRFDDVARLALTSTADYPTFDRTTGTARGVDVFARKTNGWFTGQISYSYTGTRLSIDDTTAPPAWNVPHTLQGLAGIWLGDYWQFRVAGTWRSGLPYTPAAGSFRAPVSRAEDDRERFIEGAVNSERLPDYVRFDVSLRRTYQAEWFDWTLYVQALNVLNRTNPVRIDTRQLYRGDSTQNLPPGIESSMPIIPSVGAEFQF